MKKSGCRGLTLVELMAILAVFALIVMGLIFLFARVLSTGGGHNQEAATHQAQDWAQSMGLVNAKVACAAAVGGKDSMVPCSVAIPGKNGPLIYGLECGPAISLRGQEGCRITNAPTIAPVGVSQ